jgi:hypothetical protein
LGTHRKLKNEELGATHRIQEVRAAVVDLLRVLRLGDPVVSARQLADQDSRVRLPALRGLVSPIKPN